MWVGNTLLTRDFGDGNPFPVPEDDPAQAKVVRVLAPRGSLVLWDGRLPHQNYPNTGSDFRVVMYLNLHPANLNEDAVQKRRDAAQKIAKKLVVMKVLGHDNTGVFPNMLTPLGRQLLGLPGLSDETLSDETWQDDRLHEAIRLAYEAGLEEQKGNLMLSMEKHMQALKKWEPIEQDWYEAIFA